jgi:hypothetical protein
MFDSDAACKKLSHHWRRLGSLYEKAAQECVERGSFDSAMKAARMAEACFWQATGEQDFISISDVLPKAEAA